MEARLPAAAERETLRAAPEWIEANDLIYWRNGICDRTFYDAALANAPLWRVPAAGRGESGTASGWAEFVGPEPRHALLLSKRVCSWRCRPGGTSEGTRRLSELTLHVLKFPS